MNTFTLESALENWRATAAASEGISKEAVDEMEEHLRQSTTDLEARGLSLEEAFLIASRRLGSCEILDREFSSVSASTVWRRRVFWMLLGFIDITLMLTIVSIIGGIGTWAAAALAPSAWLPLWSTLAYAVPVLLLLIVGIASWRWIVRSSSDDIVGVVSKYPVLFSVGVLVAVLVLRGISYVYTAFAAHSLPTENFANVATHTTIAGIAIGTLSLIAVCVGLGTMAKSFGQAKTS